MSASNFSATASAATLRGSGSSSRAGMASACRSGRSDIPPPVRVPPWPSRPVMQVPSLLGVCHPVGLPRGLLSLRPVPVGRGRRWRSAPGTTRCSRASTRCRPDRPVGRRTTAAGRSTGSGRNCARTTSSASRVRRWTFAIACRAHGWKAPDRVVIRVLLDRALDAEDEGHGTERMRQGSLP